MLLDGNLAEAARYFGESLALWPGDPNALVAAGRADLRAGNTQGAIDKLGRCPSFECRMELARAYVVGPRDLAAARRELASARTLTQDPRLIAEVDSRIQAIDAMGR